MMFPTPAPHVQELTFFAPFNGLGIGARGFLDAQPTAGNVRARWVCLGGVDSDAGANANASRLCGVPFTTLDLFSREQYTDFHGKEPPAGWREATPADILNAARYRHPDALMLSPPCKGYSGLLAEKMSVSAKYQALNALAMRGVWLCLEAFKDQPPHLVLLENVPRIANRGRRFLDQIKGLLMAYGYACAETVHDCGEIGGLAQTRKRFLLVARRMATVPNYLYQPPVRPLRAVGDVLGRLPVPGTTEHPLHQLPNLKFKTWVRLAFVQAGRDWRSLERLRVVNGQLAEYGLLPIDGCPSALDDPRYAGKGEYGQYGVLNWSDVANTVSGQSAPGGGRYSVADPRCPTSWGGKGKYLVTAFDRPANTVIAGSTTGNGAFAVADPRLDGEGPRFNNIYRVVKFADASPTVSGGIGPTSGGLAVADPRTGFGPSTHHNVLKVGHWDSHAMTVTGAHHPSGGLLSVADPRPQLSSDKGTAYLSAGHYGVTDWASPSLAVTGSGQHDNGRNSVADPRLPEGNDKVACVIVSEDGTWHRPFSTLETAALQAIFDPEDYQGFSLDGRSDEQVREWIGNAIPRSAACAIAEQFGQALLLCKTEQTFVLSADKVWVQPLVIALQCGQGA